jgi:hypothetical protein
VSAVLHVILVGIDDYPLPVRPLRGSVNDVDAMEAYLRNRFAGDDAARVLVLRDAEATRAGVIDAFRSQLGRARPGDTALFHFSVSLFGKVEISQALPSASPRYAESPAYNSCKSSIYHRKAVIVYDEFHART